jgi:hypothetical protein
MASTWVQIIRTISGFLPSIGKVHPPYNLMTGLDPHLTHRLEGNSTFSALALKAPFSFYMHVIRRTEFLNSRRNPIYIHLSPAFEHFELPLTLHSKPLDPRSFGLPKGPPRTW